MKNNNCNLNGWSIFPTYDTELAHGGALGGGVVRLHHDGEDGVRSTALRIHVGGSSMPL